MKAGLATSVTLHAVLIGLGVVSLSAPKPFEVADVESLPVEIVPFEEIPQAALGDKQAPVADKPAPVPTQRPETVPEAQKVGDADVDTNVPPTPTPKPKPVQKAEEPAPAPEPAPKPVEKPVEQAKVEPPAPKPAPEPAPKPAEKPEPPKDAVPEAPAEQAEKSAAESLELPRSAPVPQSRPRPQQPQKVAEEKPKPVEKPAKEQLKTAQRTETQKKDVLDEVAALLNKEQSSGGGAKRSTDQAALGNTRANPGQKLSQSELDGLRAQIQKCWIIPAGAQDAQNLKFSLQFKLAPDGTVEGNPQVISGGGSSPVERAAIDSARRAILRCGPYNLPAEKYDAWADVIVHFDPSDMF
ncbi:hypothetical protein GCM10023174_15570 [Chelativorans composti]|jgi:Predicted membrane protein|uniref:Cell division and transport-associated protein TolA n=1 Tax=Chelativorans composti TaxID=768533 RepID=A0ABW5DEV6_9HYPH